MATIELYGMKTKTLSDSFFDLDISIENLKNSSSLTGKKLNRIDSSVYDTSVIQGNIQAITDIQVEEKESLDKLIEEIDDFYELALSIDDDVADMIEESKDDFYKQYSYLRPDSEKSDWENFCDDFCDACEWCRENWKAMATVLLVLIATIAIIVVVVGSGGAALGPIAGFIFLAAKGVIIGAATGGLIGGVMGYITSGFDPDGFVDGFVDGAFSGAVSGLLTCGLSAAFGGGVKAAFEFTLKQEFFIGALAEAGTSLIGNIGDILIKGDDISLLEVIFDTAFSFGTGGLSALGTRWLSDNWKISFDKINGDRNNNSWKKVWMHDFEEMVARRSKMPYKSVIKAFGSDLVDGIQGYAISAGGGFVGWGYDSLKDLIKGSD